MQLEGRQATGRKASSWKRAKQLRSPAGSCWKGAIDLEERMLQGRQQLAGRILLESRDIIRKRGCFWKTGSR
jgi:hypothetical protein